MEKKYALKLGEGGRIFYATSIEFAPQDAVYVEDLPPGDIADYCYVNGEIVYNPLPEPEQPEEVSLEEQVAELREALELLLSGVTE